MLCLLKLSRKNGDCDMLIINGKILTMGKRNYERGYLRTEGDKIIEVGEMKDLQKGYESKQDEQVLDVDGAWVMPGLIDAHCHVGIVEEKMGVIGDDCNETTTPVTPHIRALDGVNPMDASFHDAIMAGITSIMTGPGSSNVVCGQSVFMKVQGRCIDRMVVKAPAAMKIAFGENPKVNYGEKDVMPGSRMGIAGMLREELFRAKLYQQKKEQERISAGEEDFRMECWLPVMRKEIPLKAHVHRADDILTAIRIAKEFDLKLTLDHCTEGHLIVDEIKESGFPVIVGPDLTSRSKLEVKNVSFKTAGVLEKAGVKTAIMTDHPVSLIQYLPLCAGLCVKQGLSMENALRAITITAAEICGVDDRVGSLEVGKDADIAIFSDNPMNVFTRTRYTIINGKIEYQELLDRQDQNTCCFGA